MAKLSRPIVVNCSSFDDLSGGSIVSHYLVHRLRGMGVEAYTFPLIKESAANASPLASSIRRAIMERKYTWRLSSFRSHPSLDAPLATLSALRRGIAVYPEIVRGNPLGCPHVARWILFTPGGFKQGEDFVNPTPGEEVFYFQRPFIEHIDWIPRENWLMVQWHREDIFFDPGPTERTHVCRMIRKGTDTADLAPPGAKGAILLDGKSNEQIAAIFKKSRIFYCHDPYTMYCDYAALCGCLPVVVPPPGLSRADWRPEEDRYGIAYGDSPEQLDWAAKTRSGLIQRIADLKRQEDRLLANFVDRLASAFC